MIEPFSFNNEQTSPIWAGARWLLSRIRRSLANVGGGGEEDVVRGFGDWKLLPTVEGSGARGSVFWRREGRGGEGGGERVVGGVRGSGGERGDTAQNTRKAEGRRAGRGMWGIAWAERSVGHWTNISASPSTAIACDNWLQLKFWDVTCESSNIGNSGKFDEICVPVSCWLPETLN